MGHHLGHIDHVLHQFRFQLCQRSSRLPHSMGTADDSCRLTVLRSLLPSGIPKVTLFNGLVYIADTSADGWLVKIAGKNATMC